MSNAYFCIHISSQCASVNNWLFVPLILSKHSYTLQIHCSQCLILFTKIQTKKYFFNISKFVFFTIFIQFCCPAYQPIIPSLNIQSLVMPLLKTIIPLNRSARNRRTNLAASCGTATTTSSAPSTVPRTYTRAAVTLTARRCPCSWSSPVSIHRHPSKPGTLTSLGCLSQRPTYLAISTSYSKVSRSRGEYMWLGSHRFSMDGGHFVGVRTRIGFWECFWHERIEYLNKFLEVYTFLLYIYIE